MRKGMASLAVMATALATGYPIMGNNKNNMNRENVDITPPRKVIPKGCKEYTYEDKELGSLTVIAINEKSALKKHKKWLAEKLS